MTSLFPRGGIVELAVVLVSIIVAAGATSVAVRGDVRRRGLRQRHRVTSRGRSAHGRGAPAAAERA